jgi:hypothetical protein
VSSVLHPGEAGNQGHCPGREAGLPAELLPPALTHLEIARLRLGESTQATFAAAGARRLIDLAGLDDVAWAQLREAAPGALGELREALERIVARGLTASLGSKASRPVVASSAPPREVTTADWAQAAPSDLLASIAVHTGWHPLPGAPAASEPIEPRRLRQMLLAMAPDWCTRFRREIQRDLVSAEGALGVEQLAAGSIAARIGREASDPLAPLRLAALLAPARWHLHGKFLTEMEPADLTRLVRVLRHETRVRKLPLLVEDLETRLIRRHFQVQRGLVQRILRDDLRRIVAIDMNRGEVVLARPSERSLRLRQLLLDAGQPVAFDDLAFLWRESHHRVNRTRLRECLLSDDAFLQVGRDLWSLRVAHGADLAAAAAFVGIACDNLRREGGRQHVESLLEGTCDSQMAWMTLDHLRRDPRVRHLGRGELCLAGRRSSWAMERLMAGFRRAGSTVVLSRFLANQQPGERRLVERILRTNRLFVFPQADRVDLVANYPYPPHRVRKLVALVTLHLQLHGGTASLDSLVGAAHAGNLGGPWLDRQFLGDLLQRHSSLQFLPGGMVAVPELHSLHRIRKRAREALRSAGRPLTFGELLAAAPELAPYAEGLEEILHGDDMLKLQPGGRWRVT